MKKLFVGLIGFFLMGAGSVFAQTTVAESIQQKDSELSPYAEVTFTTRRGKDTADSYSSVGVYAEFPLGTDGLSLWLSGYKDPAFKGTYLGLAKKFGDWQMGLGAGNVHYDEVHHTVVNPWVYYTSEWWEVYAHIEHYSRETEDPLWYKGYAEKKVNNFGIGLYGEKDMGVGPRLSYKVNDHVKLWATVPMWSQPETGRMKFFLNLVLSY